MPIPNTPTSADLPLDTVDSTDDKFSQASTYLPLDNTNTEQDTTPITHTSGNTGKHTRTHPCWALALTLAGAPVLTLVGAELLIVVGVLPLTLPEVPQWVKFRHLVRPRFSEAPPLLGTHQVKWWDCHHNNIDSTDDNKLAEYLIGHSINITFPTNYWPNKGGQWTGEPIDTCTDKKTISE
jgi:hypothetical protein